MMGRQLTDRERKLIYALLPVLILAAAFEYWPESDTAAAPVADTAAAIEVAQARLQRARLAVATLPDREKAADTQKQELAKWEKRLITAETPAQAQAQLNQLFRRLASAQGGAVALRGIELGTLHAAAPYAEIRMNVNFECQIEGLINLLTDIAAQPELLAWRDLRVNSPDSKQKRINVSLTLVALTPASLLKAAKPGANP
jgi:hypothetical protein